MKGLMMDRPLLISSIVEYAVRYHGSREIVSVTAENPRHRTTYRECIARARRLANALARIGIRPGDRVATMAWNDYRHLELYYAVSGSGMVCHTINPRLFVEQLVYIINHAGDRWLFVDPMFVSLVEGFADRLPAVEGYVILTDDEHMPATSLTDAVSYESLLAAESDEFEWPEFDERTASALCYTSGTTGDPKGVLYDHRSTLLHAWATVAPNAMGLSSRDCIMPAVPLFHVNAWGTPYSVPIAGAKLVLPGPRMGDGETLFNLLDEEAVTIALGVPTIWLALLDYTQRAGKKLDKLERTIVGGAAVPRSMIETFRDRHGVEVRQGWGMTEVSPIGCVNTLKAGLETLSGDEKLDLGTKAGLGIFGCEMRIVDDEGRELPRDGETFGALQVRGPWICSGYFGRDGESGSHTEDGWLDTGDVATLDAEGYMAITDRTKDVIKSGGEWISTIELENLAMGHPAVAEAAVIGVYHPKWTERPLLVVVPAEGARADKAELLAWFDGKVASWWKPDDAVFVDELPHTATDKVKKIELRKQFADYRFPE